MSRSGIPAIGKFSRVSKDRTLSEQSVSSAISEGGCRTYTGGGRWAATSWFLECPGATDGATDGAQVGRPITALSTRRK